MFKSLQIHYFAVIIFTVLYSAFLASICMLMVAFFMQGIMDALKCATEGRTSICIAHRLSTVVDADEILVLHDGQVAEQGTHEDLLAQGGYYTRLWNSQHLIT